MTRRQRAGLGWAELGRGWRGSVSRSGRRFQDSTQGSKASPVAEGVQSDCQVG